jgi:hypothetical protein
MDRIYAIVVVDRSFSRDKTGVVWQDHVTLMTARRAGDIETSAA